MYSHSFRWDAEVGAKIRLIGLSTLSTMNIVVLLALARWYVQLWRDKAADV